MIPSCGAPRCRTQRRDRISDRARLNDRRGEAARRARSRHGRYRRSEASV